MRNDYLAFLDQRADQYGVPRDVARAMVQQESGFNPNAVSPAGAMGLMQLMPATARELGVRNPMDPYENMDGGLRYAAQQMQKYGVAGGLAAYNGGPGNWEKRGQNLNAMMPETQNYVNKIMANANGGEMNPLLNSLNAYGAVGDLRAQQVDPAIMAQIQQDKNLKASFLPLAIGAAMSSNDGAKNFGDAVLPMAMQGINPKQLKYGQILDDGTYITDVDSGTDAAMMKAMMNPGKALPSAAINEITAKDKLASQLGGITAQFKDDYSGLTPSETLGGVENWLGRAGIGTQGMKDQANWWQQYQDYSNQILRELSGAAVTLPEAERFKKANIYPGMSPDMIRERLRQQQEIADQAYSKLVQNYGRGGYNVQDFPVKAAPQIGNSPNTATGRPTGELTDEQILKQYGLR